MRLLENVASCLAVQGWHLRLSSLLVHSVDPILFSARIPPLILGQRRQTCTKETCHYPLRWMTSFGPTLSLSCSHLRRLRLLELLS